MTHLHRLLLGLYISASSTSEAVAQATVLPPLCKLNIGARADACGPLDSLVWVATNPFPRYPAVILAAGVTGSVTFEFRLRPDGAVDTTAIRFVHSTHAALEAPVTMALLTWRLRHSAHGHSPLADSLGLRVSYLITTCSDTAAHSEAAWLVGAWPPTIRVTGCQGKLIPREEVH